MVVIPGPRFPDGAHLPIGYPYQFIGIQTLSWSSVAILLAPELAQHVTHLYGVGNDRRMWMLLAPDPGAKWLLCGVYGPPGGDLPFWEELVSEYRSLSAREVPATTLIVGDCKLHLPWLVSHEKGCHCSHCRPTSGDAACVAALQAEQFRCHNPVDVPRSVRTRALTCFGVMGSATRSVSKWPRLGRLRIMNTASSCHRPVVIRAILSLWLRSGCLDVGVGVGCRPYGH